MKAVLDNNHLYLWLFNQMFKTKTIGKTFINKLIKFSPAIIGNINRKKMIDQCPDVYFEITPTVSIFSVHSLFEFHKSWVEQKLLDINNIRINILTHPRYFSITIMPEEDKKKVRELYKES